MMETAEQPEIRFLGDLQRLELKPGDRFVLKTNQHLSMEQCERIREQWELFAGQPAYRLLILDADFSLGAIALPEP